MADAASMTVADPTLRVGQLRIDSGKMWQVSAVAEGVAELRVFQPPVRDELQEQIDFIRWVIGDVPQAPEPAQLPAEPEHHFADLMLADETTDDAKARLSQRLKELRHYLIAPEIRVNEDGSLGLTSAEQAELQDLERRQTLGRWLEA